VLKTGGSLVSSTICQRSVRLWEMRRYLPFVVAAISAWQLARATHLSRLRDGIGSELRIWIESANLPLGFDGWVATSTGITHCTTEKRRAVGASGDALGTDSCTPARMVRASSKLRRKPYVRAICVRRMRASSPVATASAWRKRISLTCGSEKSQSDDTSGAISPV
jgi:hypothetical protein